MDDGRETPRGHAARPPRTLRFSAETVQVVGACLAIDFRVLGGSIPGREAWHGFLLAGDGRPSAAITLWPHARRVDLVSGAVTVVCSEVAAVRVTDEGEATFVKSDGGEVVVRRDGRVLVRG